MEKAMVDTVFRMEAGPKLDALVAVEIMRWVYKPVPLVIFEGKRLTHWWEDQDGNHPVLPNFSQDAGASFMVIEKAREIGIYLTVVSLVDLYLVTASTFSPQFNSFSHVPYADIRSARLPPAICRVALIAKIELGSA